MTSTIGVLDLDGPQTLIGLEQIPGWGLVATIEQGRYSYIVRWIWRVDADTDLGVHRLVDYDGESIHVRDERRR